jgi:hypothetical protein
VTDRRRHGGDVDAQPPPPPPAVQDLVLAPELAVVVLLEHTLTMLGDALLAEHPTLLDRFNPPREQGAVVTIAHALRHREAELRDLLRRYRRAVLDSVTEQPPPSVDLDIF